MPTQLTGPAAPPAPIAEPPAAQTVPRPARDRPRDPFRAGESLPALRQVGTPRTARRFGVLLIVSFVVLPFLLIFVPWRQAVYGEGQVIGKHPFDRQFTVDAPIYGRVVRYEVSEGDTVEPGDVIAEVENIDTQYLETLRLIESTIAEQLDLVVGNVTSYEASLEQIRLAADRLVAEAESAVREAEQKVTENERKVAEVRADLDAYAIKRGQIREAVRRGLEAPVKQVEAEQIYNTTEQKLRQAESALAQSRHTLEQYRNKLSSTAAKQESEIRKAEILVQEAEAKVRDLTNKLEEQRVKIRQQEVGVVRTPRAGKVLRLLTNVEAGAQVKDGDPLAILIPETPELAAEVYLPGRDIPLVHAGDPVRLQFEGWPAVQFVGWPSVAVGTFPGKVYLVDASDTKGGKFRVLVTPDMSGPDLEITDRVGTFRVGDQVVGGKSGARGRVAATSTTENGGVRLRLAEITGGFLPDEPIKGRDGSTAILKSPWPSRTYLRQGARTRGWVLLNEVSLGYEVWRRLNGFPPVIAEDEPTGKDASGGKDEKVKVKRPK